MRPFSFRTDLWRTFLHRLRVYRNVGFFGNPPLPDMVGHRLHPLVADPLAVGAGHVAPRVAHDVVDGNLVAGVATNRFETVPQRIEAEAVAVELLVQQQLSEPGRHRIAGPAP